jgi:hypothetical protein
MSDQSKNLKILRGKPSSSGVQRDLTREEIEFTLAVFSEFPPEEYEITGMHLAEITPDVESLFEERMCVLDSLPEFSGFDFSDKEESDWYKEMETTAEKLSKYYKSTLKKHLRFTAVWAKYSSSGEIVQAESRFSPDVALVVDECGAEAGDDNTAVKVVLCCMGYRAAQIALNFKESEADCDAVFAGLSECRPSNALVQAGRVPDFTQFVVRDKTQVLPRVVVELKRRREPLKVASPRRNYAELMGRVGDGTSYLAEISKSDAAVRALLDRASSEAAPAPKSK